MVAPRGPRHVVVGTPLNSGLRQYDAGEHEASAKHFQEALGMSLPDKDRANAHKHLAFIH